MHGKPTISARAAHEDEPIPDAKPMQSSCLACADSSVHTPKIGQNCPVRSAKGPLCPKIWYFQTLWPRFTLAESPLLTGQACPPLSGATLRQRQRREKFGKFTSIVLDSALPSSNTPADGPVRNSPSAPPGACDGSRGMPDPTPTRKPPPAAARFPRVRPPFLRNSNSKRAPAARSASARSSAHADENATRCAPWHSSTGRSESPSTSTKLPCRGGRGNNG